MLDAPAALDAETQLLERRHAENPEGRFFVPLADRCRKLGDLDRAERLLREGLQRLPDYVSARIVLAQCLADAKRTDEAAGEFRSVLAVDPQNLLALRGLGKLAAAAGEQQEAIRWYGELFAVDPMNEDARAALEELRTQPEAPPGADVAGEDLPDPHFEEVFEEVFEQPQEPGAELATETIAELYSRQGFHDRAAEVYRELLRRRGEDPILLQRLEEAETLAAPERPVTIAEALTELLAWPHGGKR